MVPCGSDHSCAVVTVAPRRRFFCRPLMMMCYSMGDNKAPRTPKQQSLLLRWAFVRTLSSERSSFADFLFRKILPRPSIRFFVSISTVLVSLLRNKFRPPNKNAPSTWNYPWTTTTSEQERTEHVELSVDHDGKLGEPSSSSNNHKLCRQAPTTSRRDHSTSAEYRSFS